jgi:hypothetical protein
MVALDGELVTEKGLPGLGANGIGKVRNAEPSEKQLPKT